MAVKDLRLESESDLRLTMAVKYWYTIQIGVLNNDPRFIVLCYKIKLELDYIL